MKLYYFLGACSLAVHIVIEWIERSYETVEMTLESTKSSAYLALNPGGTVPLLVDDGFLLTEGVAILSYLADLNPQARLLGDGSPRARAEAMRWLVFLNSDVHKAFKPIFAPARFLPDAAYSKALADNARVHVREYLARLDARLQDRDWLTGTLSVADPYLFVMVRWAVNVKVEMDAFKNLGRFLQRMRSNPGVRRALMVEEGRVS